MLPPLGYCWRRRRYSALTDGRICRGILHGRLARLTFSACHVTCERCVDAFYCSADHQAKQPRTLDQSCFAAIVIKLVVRRHIERSFFPGHFGVTYKRIGRPCEIIREVVERENRRQQRAEHYHEPNTLALSVRKGCGLSPASIYERVGHGLIVPFQPKSSCTSGMCCIPVDRRSISRGSDPAALARGTILLWPS